MLQLRVKVLSWMIISLWCYCWVTSYRWAKYPTYKLRLLNALCRLDLHNIVENKVQWIVDLILVIISILRPKSRMNSTIILDVCMIIAATSNLYTWTSSFRVLLGILLNRSCIIIDCIWANTTSLNKLLFHLRLKEFSFNFCALIFLLWVWG